MFVKLDTRSHAEIIYEPVYTVWIKAVSHVSQKSSSIFFITRNFIEFGENNETISYFLSLDIFSMRLKSHDLNGIREYLNNVG